MNILLLTITEQWLIYPWLTNSKFYVQNINQIMIFLSAYPERLLRRRHRLWRISPGYCVKWLQTDTVFSPETVPLKYADTAPAFTISKVAAVLRSAATLFAILSATLEWFPWERVERTMRITMMHLAVSSRSWKNRGSDLCGILVQTGVKMVRPTPTR